MLRSTEDRTGFAFHDHQLVTIPGTAVPQITNVECDLSAVKLEMSEFKRGSKRAVQSLTLDGTPVKYSDRFGTSLAGLLGQSNSAFNLFEPHEVIERAVASGINPRIRVGMVQDRRNDTFQALATVRQDAPRINPQDLLDALTSRDVNLMQVGYHDGGVTTVHIPSLPSGFNIGGDEMTNRFMLHLPLDGYGTPSSYLAMIRAICVNFGVLMSAAFRTQIQLGRTDAASPMPTIERFMDSFNSEEGYSAVKARMEKALQTPASLDEYFKLFSLIHKLRGGNVHAEGVAPAPWNLLAFREDSKLDGRQVVLKLAEMASGDQSHWTESYASFEAVKSLSARSRRNRAIACSVYDLFNFGTELATHYVTEGARRAVNGILGDMLGGEGGFDMENLARATDAAPRALFLNN